MQHTILELERIEKILEAKLSAAQDAYDLRLPTVRKNFKAEQIERNGRVSDMIFVGSAVGYAGEPVSGVLSKAWEEFQDNDIDLAFLGGEVDLFKRGINALYSYWNSSVEIFIDSLREKSNQS